MAVKNSFPYWLVQNRAAFKKYAIGGAPRECPICGFRGRFLPAGYPLRPDARCPKCDGLERHRLLVLGIAEMNLIKPTDQVLHFAPEPPVARVVQPSAEGYISADLYSTKADREIDIENMKLKDESFDVIVCSHVLEHVDDAKALHESYRVLRREGRLLAMVPIVEGWDRTYENPQVTSPEEREVHFGQFDHVRYYGRDFRERIIDAGFSLTEFSADGRDTVRYGLNRGERLFVGLKR